MNKIFNTLFFLLFIIPSLHAIDINLLSITVDTDATFPVRYNFSNHPQIILTPGSNLIPYGYWLVSPGKLLDANNCTVLQSTDPKTYGTLIIYKLDDPVSKMTILYFVYKNPNPDLDSYLTFNVHNFIQNYNKLDPEYSGSKLDPQQSLNFGLTFNPLGSSEPISLTVRGWRTKQKGGYTAPLFFMDDLKKIEFNKTTGILGTGWKLPAGVIPCKY